MRYSTFFLAAFLLILFLYVKPARAETEMMNEEKAADTKVEWTIEDLVGLKVVDWDVVGIITAKAIKANLEPSRMAKVVWCESRMKSDAKNPHSSARGLFQWLTGSWNYYGKQLWGSLKGKDPYNPIDNIDLAIYVIQKRGYQDWGSSKGCWSSYPPSS